MTARFLSVMTWAKTSGAINVRERSCLHERKEGLRNGEWLDYRYLVRFRVGKTVNETFVPVVRRSEQWTKPTNEWGYLSNAPLLSMEAQWP